MHKYHRSEKNSAPLQSAAWVRIDRPAQLKSMPKFGLLLLLGMIFVCISGCSVLVATPRTTRVQVTGLNNHVKEYVIVADEPDFSDLDIKLTDRYAISLDFQWLWNAQISASVNTTHDVNDDSEAPLAPWFTCKYRF